MLIMKIHFTFIFVFILSSVNIYAQVDRKIPPDFCVSQQEYRLYSLINDYRNQLALNTIPLSRSLSFVAQTHAKDLNANFSTTDHCNMHSWSDKGTWMPFCFPADQNRKNDIKDKAKELTSYPGKAWEITYWGNSDADLGSILEFWNNIPYASNMIGNTEEWSKKDWKSMGVGIDGGYVLVWFGIEADVEVSTTICETGENILNKSIPHELTVPTENTPKSNQAYFIIIGSFKNKKDANSAVNSYHQMGYPNAIMIESKGRIRVAIDSFKTSEAADNALNKYRNKFQGAWVFSKK